MELTRKAKEEGKKEDVVTRDRLYGEARELYLGLPLISQAFLERKVAKERESNPTQWRELCEVFGIESGIVGPEPARTSPREPSPRDPAASHFPTRIPATPAELSARRS